MKYFKITLIIAIFFISIPAQAVTLAENQTAYNHIAQERNFLVSIMTNLQTRMNMLALQANVLDGEIKKMQKQEASRKRAFEAREKEKVVKEAIKKAKEIQDDRKLENPVSEPTTDDSPN